MKRPHRLQITRCPGAGGTKEISRWWSEERAQPPDRVGPADAPRRVRQKALREIPAHPPGRSRSVDGIRWFPLADSLHHRLISVAPPARSVKRACSLSTGFLSKRHWGRRRVSFFAAISPCHRLSFFAKAS